MAQAAIRTALETFGPTWWVDQRKQALRKELEQQLWLQSGSCMPGVSSGILTGHCQSCSVLRLLRFAC